METKLWPNEEEKELIELKISLRISGGEAFPASLIAQTMMVIESEIFDLEYEELEIIFAELDDIDQIVKDACYHRINRFKGNSLRVSETKPGSLILAGVSAALAYWLVENTIGESIKDAYKQSELHEQLKRILLRRFPSRRKKLASKLNSRFFHPVSDPTVLTKVELPEKDISLIEVSSKLNKWDDVPPTASEWDSNSDKKF